MSGCNHPRQISNLPDERVSARGRAAADELAGEIFPDGKCSHCGCPRNAADGRKTHYVLTAGAFMPTEIHHIEQVRCDDHMRQCWP